MTFDTLFVNPNGRTSRRHFVPALLTLLAVVLFYVFVVKGRTSQWCLLVLMYPGLVLHARRLHDMGRSAWLLLVPAILLLAAFAIWLKLVTPGAQLAAAIPPTALAVAAGFALWGCIGRSQSVANRFGAPAAA